MFCLGFGDYYHSYGRPCFFGTPQVKAQERREKPRLSFLNCERKRKKRKKRKGWKEGETAEKKQNKVSAGKKIKLNK